MKRDFGSVSERLDAILEDQMAILAAKWNVSTENVEQDERMMAVRVSGTAIVTKALNALRSADSDALYHHDRTPFLDSLSTLEPTIHSLALRNGTADHRTARQTLKNLAYHIGQAASQELSKGRMQAMEVSEISYEQWEDAVAHSAQPDTQPDQGNTIPSNFEVSEEASLAYELQTIRTIVDSASRFDLQKYIEVTLSPRQAEIDMLLTQRRATYESDTSFELGQRGLIDFKNALDHVMTQAHLKTQPPAVQTATPFPALEQDAPTVVLPEYVQDQLRKAAEHLAFRAENHSAEQLNDFYHHSLKPTIIATRQDKEALQLAGNKPEKLAAVERYLAVIEAGEKTIVTRLEKEGFRFIPTLNKVVSSGQESQTSPIDLVKLKANIDAQVEKLSGKNLKAFYVQALRPELMTLKQEIASLKAAGRTSEELTAKEKYFGVIYAGAQSILHKLNDEQSARLATRFAAHLATRPAPEAPVSTVVLTPPTPTSRDVTDAETLPFKEIDVPSDAPQKPNRLVLWGKRIAAGVSGLILVGVMSIVGGQAMKDHKHDDTKAKDVATAQAEFNTVATPAYHAPVASPAPAQAAPYVTPPANDVIASAQPAPAVAETAPKSVKVARAKADFRPAAAANDTKVTYNSAIVAEPFDIATTRVGLDTLTKACGFLKANGATVPNGVCSDFTPNVN